jgi:hypothetical protein
MLILDKAMSKRKNESISNSTTETHCAGCNLYGKSSKMKHSRPIPEHCCIPLPYQSNANSRLCPSCRKIHHKQQKYQLESNNNSYSTTSLEEIVPQILKSGKPVPRYYLQNSNSLNNNNNNDNSRLQILSDVSSSSSGSTTLQNLRYQGDIYTLLSRQHLDYLKQLETKYNSLPSFDLQLSVATGDETVDSSTSSSTNAEIRLKCVLEILVYLIYFIDPVYRLNMYSDCLMDIGSGAGHFILLAYAGMGIEKVVGVELVSSRAIQSIADLNNILKHFKFESVRGYVIINIL